MALNANCNDREGIQVSTQWLAAGGSIKWADRGGWGGGGGGGLYAFLLLYSRRGKGWRKTKNNERSPKQDP